MVVWVRSAEREQGETQHALRALNARCAGKCFVAVYFSGREDLAEQTSRLLRSRSSAPKPLDS